MSFEVLECPQVLLLCFYFSLVDDLSEQNEANLRSKETELRLQNKERKSLIYKLTDAAAVIVKLEEENNQIQTANK